MSSYAFLKQNRYQINEVSVYPILICQYIVLYSINLF